MEKNTQKKVLIVEDDISLLNILFDKLSNQNYEVLKAEDGKKAIELVYEKKPNLILLDLLLPEADGYEVLKTIRKHEDKEIAETIVIVLSNLWSEKDILSAQALKIDEYFVKTNTDLKQVVERVAVALARSK